MGWLSWLIDWFSFWKWIMDLSIFSTIDFMMTKPFSNMLWCCNGYRRGGDCISNFDWLTVIIDIYLRSKE